MPTFGTQTAPEEEEINEARLQNMTLFYKHTKNKPRHYIKVNYFLGMVAGSRMSCGSLISHKQGSCDLWKIIDPWI